MAHSALSSILDRQIQQSDHPSSNSTPARPTDRMRPGTKSDRRERRVCLMASVVFYFQIHQPFRLRRYSVFDSDRHYFDDYKNADIVRKVAQKCYLPANRVMLDTIRAHDG